MSTADAYDGAHARLLRHQARVAAAADLFLRGHLTREELRRESRECVEVEAERNAVYRAWAAATAASYAKTEVTELPGGASIISIDTQRVRRCG